MVGLSTVDSAPDSPSTSRKVTVVTDEQDEVDMSAPLLIEMKNETVTQSSEDTMETEVEGDTQGAPSRPVSPDEDYQPLEGEDSNEYSDVGEEDEEVLLQGDKEC